MLGEMSVLQIDVEMELTCFQVAEFELETTYSYVYVDPIPVGWVLTEWGQIRGLNIALDYVSLKLPGRVQSVQRGLAYLK